MWGHLVQQLHHAFSLLGSPHLDGGSTANPAVLLLDFGGSTFGDDWCQPTKSFNMRVREFYSTLATQNHFLLNKKKIRRILKKSLRRPSLWKRELEVTDKGQLSRPRLQRKLGTLGGAAVLAP